MQTIAGLIIGRDAGQGFSGVAPDAKAKTYRILGCSSDSVWSDVIISGLTTAASDGVDLITLSSGAPSGFRDESLNAVASSIVQSGIPIIAPVSKDGIYGAFVSSSPSGAADVISVGSVDVTEDQGFTVPTVQSPDNPSPDVFLKSFAPFTLQGMVPLVPITTNPDAEGQELEDACAPEALAKLGDLSQSVVMMPRSGCGSDGGDQLTKQNANNVFMWNFKEPQSASYLEYQNFAIIPYEQAVPILQAIASGASVSANFDQQHQDTRTNKETGGRSYTSGAVGPTWEMYETVHVSSPGNNAFAPWPVKKGGYTMSGGPPVSTAITTGAAALLISQQGKDAIPDLRSRLSSRSVPFKQVNSDSPESTVRAGAGLLDAFAAVTGTISASPSALSLNDTQHFNGAQSIEVFNYGSNDVSFSVNHVPAATLLTVDPASGHFVTGVIPIDESAVAQVAPDQTSFTVPAGQSYTLQVTITPPTSSDPKTVPVYSGRILLSTTDGDTLNIPYMGVASDMGAMPTIDTTTAFSPSADALPILTDPLGNTIKDDNHVFTLASNDTWYDSPLLFVFKNTGAEIITVDLVPADTTFQPTIAINDGDPSSSSKAKRAISQQTRARMVKRHSRHRSLIGTPASLSRRQDTNGTAAAQEYGNTGIYTGFSRDFYDEFDGPNFSSFSYIVKPELFDFATGTAVPVQDGEYRLLYRVSKIFTEDFSDEANFESYLSHAFTIQQQDSTSNGASNSTHAGTR